MNWSISLQWSLARWLLGTACALISCLHAATFTCVEILFCLVAGVLQSAWDNICEWLNWGGSAEELQHDITHIILAIEKGCVKFDCSTVLAAIQATEALLDRHKVFQLRQRHR
eukprot:5404495-Amphidinium_carterae.1